MIWSVEKTKLGEPLTYLNTALIDLWEDKNEEPGCAKCTPTEDEYNG